MNITGGSFGPDGKAKITMGGKLAIRSAEKAEYSAADVRAVSYESTGSNKEFRPITFIGLAIVLCFVGLLVLGVIGAAIGFVVAIAASFAKSDPARMAKIEFFDGKHLTVTGIPAEFRKLRKLHKAQ